MKRSGFLAATSCVLAAATCGRARASEAGYSLQTTSGLLRGTLSGDLSTNPPVAVIVPDLGFTDGTGDPSGTASDPYALLAAALGSQGVASLRYGKRDAGVFEAHADDVVGWVRKLRDDGRFTQVLIAGHGTGSLAGMLASQRIGVDAYVSLAGAGRPAETLLREQLASRPSNHVPQELSFLLGPSVPPYYVSWFKYDPAIEIAKVDVPVTIVQGTADVQVGISDALALRNARPSSALVVVDGMNHALKLQSAPSVPVAGLAVDAIAAAFL